MGNTYRQAYFHLVYAVKYRAALIQPSWKSELEKYTTKLVQEQGHKLIAVGAATDHIHLFIGYNLNQTIPDLVEEVKTSTTKWINNRNFCNSNFKWQNGYGAFTNAHSQIDAVAKYVLNQEKHHRKVSFRDEYLEMLRKNEIKYKDEYLFEFFE